MNIYLLSKINNQRYKKYLRGFYITTTLASLLFLFFISITKSIKLIYVNVAEENLLAKQIIIRSYKNDETGNLFKEEIDSTLIEYISKENNVDQTCVKYQLVSDFMNLSIDDLTIPTHYLPGVDPNYFTFCKLDHINIENNYGKIDRIFLAGRDFQQSDEKKAIIDENFVYFLGYQDVNDILGKKINISKFNETVEDIIIIGVFDYRYGSSPGNLIKNWTSMQRESIIDYGWAKPVILSKDVIDSFSEEFFNIWVTGQQEVVFDVKSINDVDSIYQLAKNYTNNIIHSSMQENKKIINQLENISVLIFIISALIMTVSFISIFTSTINKIYTQRKFLKMMFVMGYTIKNIVKMFIFSKLIILKNIFFTYTIIIYSITIYLEFLLKPYYSIITPNLNNVFVIDFFDIVLYTFALFAVSLIITIFTSWFQIKRLLNENARGEK